MVIPTFNGMHLLRVCLTTLLAHPPSRCDWRLIVVDDASDDDTVAALRSEFSATVEVVALERNGGFATACNAGAAQAGAVDHLVFLNNDTVPIAGWLDALVAEAESPEVGAVGAKLLFADGTVQHAGVAISRDGWPRHLYTGFPGEHPAVNRRKRVAAVTAACVLVKRSLFEQVGGFDTAFHNGYEDIDLCHRLTEAGSEIRYCPQSVLYHFESVTRWPDGVPHSTAGNDALYRERWAEATPDDLEHYVADRLVEIEYHSCYPQRLRLDPLLASVLAADGEPTRLAQILEERSWQVLANQSATVRNAVEELRDAQLRAPAAPRRERGAPRPVRQGSPHQLGTGGRLVSLVMPLMNAAEDLREILPAVLSQKADCRLEIVGVDSSSEDETRDVLAEFDATVLSIDRRDFDHGLTRNAAAEAASGDVVVFVNGRTRPVGDGWLAPLLDAIDADPTVVGACSRIVPRDDADLLTRRDGLLEVSGSPERWVKRIDDWEAYAAMPEQERRLLLNFHTVSAAIRRDALLRIPFQQVRTIGEDLLWAREVLESGRALVHEPDSVAQHSHNYNLRSWFERNVDDGAANHDVNGRTLSEADAAALAEGMIAGDWAYLRDELGLTGAELERWQLRAAMRRAAQVAGQWLGANHDEFPPETLDVFSRVANARRPRS